MHLLYPICFIRGHRWPREGYRCRVCHSEMDPLIRSITDKIDEYRSRDSANDFYVYVNLHPDRDVRADRQEGSRPVPHLRAVRDDG